MADVDLLYHVATEHDWSRRTATHYQPSGIVDEGFVHLSSAEQLVATLHRHYPGRRDLILLTVDPTRASAELVWEDISGSGVAFPHIYGAIELSAVVAAEPLPCDENGRFDRWQPPSEP
ncbi:MAG: DUF952 domain-containing protein [Acidimicrobiales bacterium]